jgi:hypothetical protein
MTEAVHLVRCRLCTSLVARDAAVCPSCDAKEPWIPDEPTLSGRVIRLVMWGGAIVLVGLLFIVSGVLMFAPADDERDHRPPATGSARHDSR